MFVRMLVNVVYVVVASAVMDVIILFVVLVLLMVMTTCYFCVVVVMEWCSWYVDGGHDVWQQCDGCGVRVTRFLLVLLVVVMWRFDDMGLVRCWWLVLICQRGDGVGMWCCYWW